jgi:hypothetical protein
MVSRDGGSATRRGPPEELTCGGEPADFVTVDLADSFGPGGAGAEDAAGQE